MDDRSSDARSARGTFRVAMSGSPRRAAFVIVATRGRSDATAHLVACLARQSQLPAGVIVVGAEASDLPSLAGFPDVLLVTSPAAGLTAQRNHGLDLLDAKLAEAPHGFVAFFDDDFRPHPDWLRSAGAAFEAQPGVVGLTGHVLADGVKGQAISEDEASALLRRTEPPRSHWSAGPRRGVESLYGCNMAFSANAARVCRFDEALPLYGWQEDCDYTGQARRLGDTILEPTCQGVHLGVKSARSSGLRLGYSQIANPIRIAGRRNMTVLRMLRFVARAVGANVLRSRHARADVDYRGRLRGNLLALQDLLRGRCRPERILDF